MAAKASSAAPRSDAWVGILAVSLIAQIIGVVFFFLDWNQYTQPAPKQPPAVTPLAAPPR